MCELLRAYDETTSHFSSKPLVWKVKNASGNEIVRRAAPRRENLVARSRKNGEKSLCSQAHSAKEESILIWKALALIQESYCV